MDNLGFKSMTAEELRQYISRKHENEYLIVDVRQPEEYAQGHIPGAQTKPLMELEANPFWLPTDRDLVFYCSVGGRSAYAASVAVEIEISHKAIYNLMGGFIAWEYQTVPSVPLKAIFNDTDSLKDILMTIINMEKGTCRFYNHLRQRFPDSTFAPVMENLAGEEYNHARAIYKNWARTLPSPPSFEALYEGLEGQCLESGQPLSEAMARLATVMRNPCHDILGLSLSIEYAALDLYRSVAEQADDETVRQLMLTIAQGEKGHIHQLVKAIEKCSL